MKTGNIIGIFLAGFLVLTAVQGCNSTSSPATSPQPTEQASSQPSVTSPAGTETRNPQGMEGLGSITFTLDTARQVSGTFDVNKGETFTLGVKDANGYAWMLSIPPDALLTSETITMTPFATMDVSHSVARMISGVRLEPDGLQFGDAVQLSVRAPIDNPGFGLIFSMQQDGSDVDFAPTSNTSGGKTSIATIWHFSSAGYDNGDHAGQAGEDAYREAAEQEYQLALDAANLFLGSRTPSPPQPPNISLFCRGTEVNPEEGEAYEYAHQFLEPYSDIVSVLFHAMKALDSMGDKNMDTSLGFAAGRAIMEMAEGSIIQLGNMYQVEKPPYRLIAVIDAGQQTERLLNFFSGEPAINAALASWGEVVRDYYLDQLKTRDDYRAFPSVMTYNKQVELMGGEDRLEDIRAAMTFEVVIDTSFDGSWTSSGNSYATGHVEQNADVKSLTWFVSPTGQDQGLLWGELNNLILKVKTGTFTNPTGNYKVPSPYNGQLYLKNWDACVTKSFDVLLSGFSGGEDSQSRNAAGPASRAGFTDYYWKGLGFIFTVPMKNQDVILGDQNFSGSGSAADGEFTGSGKIHIVIKHTP